MIGDLIIDRSCGCVPNSCCAVETAGCDQSSIRAKCNIAYSKLMTWNSEQLLTRSSIPYDCGCIETACCQTISIRTEGQVQYFEIVSSQRQLRFAGFGNP